MKRIVLIDCIGRGWCANGIPVGHSLKSLNQYSEILSEEYKVSVVASSSIINNINFEQFDEIIPVPFITNHIEGRNKKFNKLKETCNMLWVLCLILYKKFDLIWFYNVNSLLLLLLLFIPKKNQKKVICTVYQLDYTAERWGRLKNRVFIKCKKKLGLIISTVNIKDRTNQMLYIPDYLYKSEYYEKYMSKKENEVVCLGTVSKSKKIEEVYEVFESNGYRLVINGKFNNREQFEKLHSKKSKNIEIENIYLSEKEYFTKLAKAKFAILPYDEKAYFLRTSGVLQECIFVDTVPIAHRDLLNNSGVLGVEIESIEDLRNYSFDKVDVQSIINENRKICNNTYDYNKNKKIILAALKNLYETSNLI